jgi:tetratricopeptide (TPR) repeat protein
MRLYQSAGDFQSEVDAMNMLANMFLLVGETDSAMHHYTQALTIAKQYEDIGLQIIACANMGLAYSELTQYDDAKRCIRQALLLRVTSVERAHDYRNLADVFILENRIDSARFYFEMAEPLLKETDDVFKLASLVYSRYQMEKAVGNYSAALEYSELYVKYQLEVTEREDRQMLLELQKKYDHVAQENEYNKSRSNFWRLIVILSGVLLGLLLIIIVMKRNNRMQAAALSKAQQQACTLQEMFNQRDNERKKLFLEKMGIIKKIAVLSPFVKQAQKNKQDNDILLNKLFKILDELKPQSFIDIANELLPNFTEKLKKICPELNDRELCVCCLIYFGFNNEELDLLLNNRVKGTLSSIQHCKSIIRQKLNIPPYSDIQVYLSKIAA